MLGERKSVPRGIPSSQSLYFPSYNSEGVRPFQDANENQTRNLWRMKDVVNLVFSREHQPTYFEIACKFLELLCGAGSLGGRELGEFVSSNGISKATFYNRVLPRLRRVGMIKVERDTVVAVESRRKYRPMRISLSKTFGNCFSKVGDSWLALVDEARLKK